MDNPDCIISNVASGDEVICKVSSTNFLTQICKQKKLRVFLNIQALKLHSVLWQKQMHHLIEIIIKIIFLFMEESNF